MCEAEPDKGAKYLGAIIDDKLMWKVHVRAQVKKGLKALWSCNANWQDLETFAQDGTVVVQMCDNP